MISIPALTVLVFIALGASALSIVLLIVLAIRDIKESQLW